MSDQKNESVVGVCCEVVMAKINEMEPLTLAQHDAVSMVINHIASELRSEITRLAIDNQLFKNHQASMVEHSLSLASELNAIKFGEWHAPDETPVVPMGTERLYWVTAERTHPSGDKTRYTYLAHYQNRPLRRDSEGDIVNDDWQVVDEDDEPIHSVGWVSGRDHHSFDDFYEPIDFNDEYRLLGWAPVHQPEFPM